MDAGILATETLQSWRNLLRRPRYLIVSAFTLALGVATVTAMFTLLHQVLLKPLPFPEPDKLVAIGMAQKDDAPVGAPAFYRVLDGASGIASVGIASGFLRNVNVVVGETAVVGAVLVADREFLDTLGTTPAMGRNFNVQEDTQGGARVALISHAFWTTHFGADKSVVGRQITAEGAPMTIIGVLPRTFVWLERFDLLTPMRLPAESADVDANQYIVARMRSGTSVDSVRAEAGTRMRGVIEDLRAQLPLEAYDYFARQRFAVEPLTELYRGDLRSSLWLFFAAATGVLLIAAINLANLVILRAVLRSHDSAVRAALGASGLRLALPSFAEAVLTALAGSVAGIALGWAGLRLFARFAPAEWANAVTDPGPASWAFAATAGLATALGAALVGTWRGRGMALLPELVGGGRSGPSRGAGLFGRSLVIAQIGLAALLLMVAGLFMRSLHQMSSVPMGFSSDAIVTFSLAPVRKTYPDISAVNRQVQDVLARLRELPEVEHAAVSSNLPAGSQLNFPANLGGQPIQPQFRPVSPDHFAVFDIPLAGGRLFTERDAAGGEPVCIVSRAFAERHFRGEALGKTVRMGREESGLPPMRIVGVVGDVRLAGPTADVAPTLYVPIAQLPASLWPALREFTPLHYAVRTRIDGASLEPALRHAVSDASPLQAITDVRPMRRVVDDTMSHSRLQMLLVGIFATLALVLASVGLYAILSVTVAARSHEYGLRVALGARPRQLVAMVLRDTLSQLGAGLAIGIAAALALSGLVRRFLFEVPIFDPVAIAFTVAALSLAGLLASLLPALRVARADPIRAFRMS